MTETIKDAQKNHWVYRAPENWRPFLQLSRLDRPIGYWLLALPGWIGLAFASLSHGLEWTDLKWAALIFIGAIAMRGAGCTYNDIVDRDLDAQVDRTALRPIPAGTVSVKQAWLWLFAQCFIGLLVLLTLPRFAQIVAVCSIPLVAAYPFMKRITWWPQVWLGLTFNWAVLVAYAIKTDMLSPGVIVLYLGLMFWTVGYDTIYACQDMEDDALIGVKSTARRFGKNIKLGIGLSFALSVSLITYAYALNVGMSFSLVRMIWYQNYWHPSLIYALPMFIPLALHFVWQVWTLKTENSANALGRFKSNFGAALILIGLLLIYGNVFQGNIPDKDILSQMTPRWF